MGEASAGDMVAMCWNDNVLDILSKILKFHQFLLSFLSITFRKYKIMCEACVIFLLDSVELAA